MTTFDRVGKPAQRFACALIAGVFLLVAAKEIFDGAYKHGAMELVTGFTYGWLAFQEPCRSRAGTLLLVVLAVASLSLLFAVW